MRNSNAQLIWLCHQRTFARCFPALAVWKLWRPCRRKGVSQSHRTVLPLTKDEYITSVKTFAQLNKIDITVQIETSLGRKIKLFIEDKTFSNEHNQLSVYDKFIDDINDYEVYKIFIKPIWLMMKNKSEFKMLTTQTKQIGRYTTYTGYTDF